MPLSGLRHVCLIAASLAIVATGHTTVFAQSLPSVVAGARAVTLPKSCDLGGVIATVHVRVVNSAAVATGQTELVVSDSPHALTGTLPVAPIPASGSVALDIPLTIDTSTTKPPPLGAAGIAGKHMFNIADIASLAQLARGVPSITTAFTIPPSFCAAAIAAQGAPKGAVQSVQVNTNSRIGSLFATPVPAVAPALSQSARAIAPVAIPTPTPIGARSLTIGQNAQTYNLTSPNNLRSVIGTTDCAGHQGTTVVSCMQLITTGALILIWDPPAIKPDAFRVYIVDKNGAGTSVLTSVNGGAMTLAELPTVVGGYAGRCYAVSAVTGARESDRSNTFCATTGSYATHRIFSARYSRSTVESRVHEVLFAVADQFVNTDRVVGYQYTDQKSVIGDSYGNLAHRSAFGFDVTTLRNSRLLSARLRLTIDKSYGKTNNYSCASQIASGVEFWWKSDASVWMDGTWNQAVPIGTTGPEVSADVTSIVAPWLNGAPNYGFVARNPDENMYAFTNGQCETSYINPLLDVWLWQ